MLSKICFGFIIVPFKVCHHKLRNTSSFVNFLFSWAVLIVMRKMDAPPQLVSYTRRTCRPAHTVQHSGPLLLIFGSQSVLDEPVPEGAEGDAEKLGGFELDALS